jgi:hypothetical protein
MSKSGVIVIGVLGVAFVLGLVRLIVAPPWLQSITAEAAEAYATGCFPPSEIPANTAVSVHRLGDDPKLTIVPAKQLLFEATEAISPEPRDPQLRAKLTQAGPVTLPKDTEIRVSRGEFTLPEGSVEVHRPGSRSFILRTAVPVRFRQAENTNYVVRLSDGVEVTAPEAAKQRTLPAGTKGILPFPGSNQDGQPLLLVPIQPLSVSAVWHGTCAIPCSRRQSTGAR